jgi:hypothetical protein
MNRCYKFTVELPEGTLIQYIEVENRWPVRQAEFFQEKWFFYSTTSNSSYLADQPVSDLCEMTENIISTSEFEKIWALSTTSQVPPATQQVPA